MSFEYLNVDYVRFRYLIPGISKAISALLIMWFLIKKGVVRIKWKIRIPWLHLMMYGLSGIVLMILTHLIISGKSDGSINYNIQSVFNVIVPVLIVAPVAEELIYRNGIQEVLTKKYNYHFAIFFTAILFGLDHVLPLNFDWLVLLNHFVSGLILGYVFYFSKSIIISMSIHFLFNLLIVLSII